MTDADDGTLDITIRIPATQRARFELFSQRIRVQSRAACGLSLLLAGLDVEEAEWERRTVAAAGPRRAR